MWHDGRASSRDLRRDFRKTTTTTSCSVAVGTPNVSRQDGSLVASGLFSPGISRPWASSHREGRKHIGEMPNTDGCRDRRFPGVILGCSPRLARASFM